MRVDERRARAVRTAVRATAPRAVAPGVRWAAAGGLRTLAQRFRGRTYYYAPEARGRVRPGRLLSWRFDATLFPDLADAAVLAVLKVESFRMTFPVARIV